ncbi:MAG TPA: carbonic anhydrase, partial [Patescibacteria group bacterium]|nr:carbonic anhydrase [Patescibacteria group bacterium]
VRRGAGVDAIDRVLRGSRLPDLGPVARARETNLKLAILTCMDARIDAAGILGLQPPDAHIVRNAGGRVTDDAIRSIALSQAVLGTREVMVIHHTDCALGRMTQAEIAARVEAATGHRFAADAGSFADPAKAVTDDLERLRNHPHIAHRDKIRGFIYDLVAGTLTEVAAPTGDPPGAVTE